MSIKKIPSEYKSLPKKDMRNAAIENFIFGILGSTIVVFISLKIDIAVLVAYLVYYFYVGRVINRPKYVTSIGKFILFPIPTALGAFAGYKIASLLAVYIQ